MSDITNLFDDLNGVVTDLKPLEDKPKRFIFSRIEGTNDLLLRIDNSSLEVFVTCPRAAQYKLVQSREAHPSPALAFGNRIHECLEHTYKNGFDQTIYRQCIQILEQRFVENPFPSDEWRSLEFAVGLVQRYYTKYQLDLDTFEPLSVESPFSLPLCDLKINGTLPVTCEDLLGEVGNHEAVWVDYIRVYWSGKIDMVTRHRANDKVNFWDHKTSSVMGEQFFKGFMQAQQTVGYAWASKKIHDFDFIPGFVLNAMGIRKPTKTGVSIELDRMPYQYSEAQLAEWERDMQCLVSDFVAHLRQGYFPKATQWCFGKFSQCPYFGVCMCDTPEERQNFLNSNAYHDVSWTPFDKPAPVDFTQTRLVETVNPDVDQIASITKFL